MTRKVSGAEENDAPCTVKYLPEHVEYVLYKKTKLTCSPEFGSPDNHLQVLDTLTPSPLRS